MRIEFTLTGIHADFVEGLFYSFLVSDPGTYATEGAMIRSLLEHLIDEHLAEQAIVQH